MAHQIANEFIHELLLLLRIVAESHLDGLRARDSFDLQWKELGGGPERERRPEYVCVFFDQVVPFIGLPAGYTILFRVGLHRVDGRADLPVLFGIDRIEE